MSPPDSESLRDLSDEQLHDVRQAADDELRSRAFERIEEVRWDVGTLRDDLANLPERMPLLVNVTIEVPGSAEPTFIPLFVTGGGLTVVNDEDIPTIYSIETQPPERTEARLIWVTPHGP